MRQCDRCEAVGKHLCEFRANRVRKFFEKVLVHTKGKWAGTPFVLADWQWESVIRPLFGTVEWSDDFAQWVRSYRIAWVELARKNGKSELLAGIALVLLVIDYEEGADIYGVARDREQASIVFNVAARMVVLSKVLSGRLRVLKSERQIVDDFTGSIYTVLPSDDLGNLGLNPHGIIFDEALTQRDAKLFNTLRQGMGTRSQPLMAMATTAGTDDQMFYVNEHEYCEEVEKNPDYDPRRLVYLRNTPRDADIWDEANWRHANPALGDFLSLAFLRDEARLAKNDPTKETSFRQYHLNQRVTQSTRWMPMETWDACSGEPALSPSDADERAKGERCFGGLDLSAKYDLSALCWVFPKLDNYALWRFWLPADMVDGLDRFTAGRMSVWAKEGWITLCPGAAINYDMIYDQIEKDRKFFDVVDLNYDPMMAAPIIQELEKRNLTSVQVKQGFMLSEPMKELMKLCKTGHFHHAGNPVMRWNVSAVEVKRDDRDRIYYIKPNRDQSGKRIDGVAAAVMAIDGVMRRGNLIQPEYQYAGF